MVVQIRELTITYSMFLHRFGHAIFFLTLIQRQVWLDDHGPHWSYAFPILHPQGPDLPKIVVLRQRAE